MKLYLYGHDYKYAAEQMLLTLFPAQRPEYPAGPPAPGEDALVLSLHRGAVWATATAALSYGGREYRAARRCRTAELTDPLSTDRALQRILKLAFYDAGTAARGGEPPWGALTGVRPVKIPTKAMLAGAGPAQAERLLRDTYRVTEGRRRLAMDCAGASLAALRSLAPGEVSLYVGIPFCPTRCAYCSFVSADVGRALKLIDPFLDALCRELAATGAMLADAGLRVRTVYFGGGTPTTLSAPQLDRLMGELAEHIDLSGCTEYTVEAGRPDTITAEKLAVLARRGCSRVSVNPQTMQDAVLERMGRAHRADDILRAYALARESGHRLHQHGSHRRAARRQRGGLPRLPGAGACPGAGECDGAHPGPEKGLPADGGGGRPALRRGGGGYAGFRLGRPAGGRAEALLPLPPEVHVRLL